MNYYNDPRMRAQHDRAMDAYRVRISAVCTSCGHDVSGDIVCGDAEESDEKHAILPCDACDDGKIDVRPVPRKRIVCPTCDGTGRHVNPSIDCGGISAEQLHDDPYFFEEYSRGTYDVTCYRCDGRNVVDVDDWQALPEAHQQAAERREREEAADRAQAAWELAYCT